MRNIKIVTDSSANIRTSERCDLAVAPLKIVSTEREFVDDERLSVADMIDYFDHYKGTSKTSCPNPIDWLHAFGDADDIVCLTITSGLSGSYNAANIAKQMYEADHPDRHVYVIDSLSAGPELQLMIEKLEEWIVQGSTYEDICETVPFYQAKTGLVFMLESLKNFAVNGRISPTIAKITGLLGIRIVGKASDVGTLEPLHKCRGEAHSLTAIVNHLKQNGLSKGKVRIAHCQNEAAADRLKERILAAFPQVDVGITTCQGLCSYYAEKGGLLVGFEKK